MQPLIFKIKRAVLPAPFACERRGAGRYRRWPGTSVYSFEKGLTEETSVGIGFDVIQGVVKGLELGQ